jgi:hypothetical protein
MLGENGWGDSHNYVDSYYGKEVWGHWRYRILTIELAKLVPAQVERLLTQATPARRAYIHFAVVNLGFLTLTGLLFFAYCRYLTGNVWLAVLGAVIFLTCRTAQSASLPLVDASAFFFLLLGMWAILRRAPFLLFMAMLIGVFAKETTLLLWPLLWLADHIATRQKLLLSALLIPGTFIYLIWRFVLDVDPGDQLFNIKQVGDFPKQLHGMLNPNGFIDIVSSFNLFWIPAGVAASHLSYPSILRRWLWLFPLIMAMIVFLGGSYGRILFLTFPVIIPLALFGIDHWINPPTNGLRTFGNQM